MKIHKSQTKKFYSVGPSSPSDLWMLLPFSSTEKNGPAGSRASNDPDSKFQWLISGNTKKGSITVLLTSCLADLD